ncbi:MAG TPA: hypothetical protein VHE36_09860 [Sphingomicrobium sp.]|nr:hypothetical protein [Sphingomicrobium sp.]
MNKGRLLAIGTATAALIGAAPAKQAAKVPPPIATYWMDVTTQSGMGAGMAGGARPSMADIMAMMNGGGGSASHMLDLRLASRDKPSAAPEAGHLIPPGLNMGPRLPLLTPQRAEAPSEHPALPAQFQQPKGRMLIYWGCGEHVSAGQPTVIDFSKVSAGQVPPGMAAMSSMAHMQTGPTSAPGFGRWPNERDRRSVPAGGSLVGLHKVEANYAPPISFSLGAGQDFMPALGLRDAGALPSGASRLAWQPAASATGYALAMFGSSGNGDVIMWSSANSAQMPALDFLAPGEVRRLVTKGSVLPPSASECVLPAEVAKASPTGMVMMVGYGPEADFADDPKAPKWTTKVRYKTSASLMRGLGGMGGYAQGDEQPQQSEPQQPQPKKRRGIGIGDVLGAFPH